MGRHSPEDPASRDRGCQNELASSLVKCMGRESAIHVCKLNGWTGVLNVIEAREPGVELD